MIIYMMVLLCMCDLLPPHVTEVVFFLFWSNTVFDQFVSEKVIATRNVYSTSVSCDFYLLNLYLAKICFNH